jgi:hypothetical protein
MGIRLMGLTIGTGHALLVKPTDYSRKVLSTASGNLIGYWMLDEVSGTTLRDRSNNGNNGVSTGFDLLYPGIGDGRSCPNLDGVNDCGNIYSAGLAGVFNGAEGTVALWLRMASAGVWSDATARSAVTLRADSNNRVNIQKATGTNNMQIFYVANSVSKSASLAVGPGTGWFHMALTWSKAADQVKAYVNGVQTGTTLTGLGTWAGSLDSARVTLGAGASDVIVSVWSGNLAHVALWTTPLTAAQIANLAKVN